MNHATPARPISRRLTVGTLGLAALASLLVAAAGVPQAEASSSTNAMLRVELVDHVAGTRSRTHAAVGWSQTAALQLELSGHAHALSITPHQAAGGVSLDLDHSRDGVVLSDDLHLAGGERRFVVDGDDTTVVVTVVSVRTSVVASR